MGGAAGSGLHDTWLPTSPTGAPTSRYAHSAVWTGTDMIVWGGLNGPTALDEGGLYDRVPSRLGTGHRRLVASTLRSSDRGRPAPRPGATDSRPTAAFDVLCKGPANRNTELRVRPCSGSLLIVPRPSDQIPFGERHQGELPVQGSALANAAAGELRRGMWRSLDGGGAQASGGGLAEAAAGGDCGGRSFGPRVGEAHPSTPCGERGGQFAGCCSRRQCALDVDSC